MIKVYDSTEKLFNNNGIKILKPLFAQITKKDNSDYYLELEDTIDNLNYYQKGLIIRTTTNWGVQGFRCDNPKIENNRIKCKAWHLTYDSKNYIVRDSNSVDKSCNAALNHFNSATDIPSPFTTISDIKTILSCRMVRKSLYEVFNELIDETKYGGHLYRDNFTFGIKSSIGEDRGVVLAANKNITGMSVSENWDDVCTKILPYTTDGQKVIALDDVYVSLTEQLYDIPYSKVVKFENPYKEEDYNDRDSFEIAVKTWLKNEAMAYLEKNKLPKVNYTVEAQINNVSDIGDVIHVKHPKCNVNLITNVISITYDCIRNKYVKIEFGNFKKEIKNLTQQITESANKYSDSLVSESNTYMKNELLDATSKINAVLGNSYVIYDGDKILIVNKLPKEEAKDVIMISNGGIGFSRTGINGTFKNAWTIDGNFCADFITTGKINTDLIEGYSNLELAVQNSLLSITPQYCIEGTDNWTDTIPTTETWQKILTRNKYVATNGKITYSKVIPYVEGMNNLINSIEGTDVSIYNSNDEEMGLESIVLEGRCTQETRSGKNLFNLKNKIDGTINGITIATNEDGSLKVNGTTVGANDLIQNRRINVGELEPGTYTFAGRFDGSSGLTHGNNGVYLRPSYSDSNYVYLNIENNITIAKTFTLAEKTAMWIQWYCNTANVEIDGNLYLWVEKGSVATSYEQYGVMPSPNYPSEVECIKGKNILDTSTSQTVKNQNSEDRNGYYVQIPESGRYFLLLNTTNTMYWGKSTNISSATTLIGSTNSSYSSFYDFNKGDYFIIWGTKTDTDKLMVAKGTNVMQYIPYSTIQIRNVGNNYLPDVVDKTTKTLNGITLSFLNNNQILLSGTSTARTVFDLTLKESIRITKDIYVHLRNNTQNYQVAIAFLKSGAQFGWTSFGPTDKISNLSGITMDELEINTLRFQINAGQTINITFQPSLEYTPNITEYKIYKSQALNINLKGNELCSIDDVKDELVIKDGRVKIIKRIGKIVFDGSEAWAFADGNLRISTGSNLVSALSKVKINTIRSIYNITHALCDYYTISDQASTKPGSNTLAFSAWGDYKFMYVPADFDTISDFKNWLSTHNMTIYFELAEEQEIDLGEVDNINLFTEDNNILNSESANMKIGYYTDYTFYKTVMEQYAKIDLNNDNINIELAKKTNSKNIIATINMSTEKDDEGSLIQINSDKLNIKNKVFNLQSDEIEIESPNFSVSKEGKINAKSGLIGGFSLDDISFHTHIEDPYTYTIADATRVLEIANGSTATEEEMKKYDVNEDGVIDRLDYTIILRKIYGYEATSGDFYILANNPRYMIKTSSNGSKVKPTKIGLSMISTTNFYGCSGSFTSFDDNTSQTVIDGGQINCVALTQTSLEQHKKNIEKLSNAIEEIKKTDIYQYNWKSESNDKKKHLGFVIGKNFNYSHLITAENGEGNEIGVDNYSMISLCLQAIKEQQIIIEDLETKINVLMKGIK